MALITITSSKRKNKPPMSIGYGNITVAHSEERILTLDDFTINTSPQYNDPEGDSVESVKIKSRPSTGSLELNNILVVNGQEIDVQEVIDGNLKYISDISTTSAYTDVIQFDLSDMGSGEYSELETGYLNMNVQEEINLPPSQVGDYSHDLNFGESLVFTRQMFTTLTVPVYLDPEGDAESEIKITSLPSNGELRFNGILVSVGQVIDFADIDLGLLVFNPDPQYASLNSVSFNYSISDVGSGEFAS